MVWVILGLVVAGVTATVVVDAYRRPTRSRSSRANSVGCLLALLAAALAAVTGYLAASDRTIEFGLGPTLLWADAIVASATAVYAIRGTRRWAHLLMAGVGVFWLALGAAALPFELAVSACACGSTGPDYIPPAIAGLDARAWILVTEILGPGLLFVGSRLLNGPESSRA
jgi:hypothetical protein